MSQAPTYITPAYGVARAKKTFKLGGKNMQARSHHYLFAHKLLPHLFFEEPELFVSGLESGCGRRLSELWDKIGSTLDEKERIQLGDFKFRRTVQKYRYFQTVFVEMPEAKGVPEAIIVAFVILKVPEKDNKVHAEYLTVDFMLPDTGPTFPVGAWTANGCHINYMSCTPDIKGLSEKIREICRYRIRRIFGRKLRARPADDITEI